MQRIQQKSQEFSSLSSTRLGFKNSYNVIVSFSMYSRLVNYWLTFRAWLGFMIWKFPLFRFMPIFDKLK